MEEKKRDSNATEEQKNILLHFMEDNVDFGKGKFIENLEGKKNYNTLWDVLAQSLNSTDGPSRDTIKWQRYWSDMKTRIKRKAAEIKKYRGATGGGPQSWKALTPFEERILYFVSSEAAYGVADPEIYQPKIRLESDIPAKRIKEEIPTTSAKEQPEEVLSDVSAPSTPSSVLDSVRDVSPGTSEPTTPSRKKKSEKVITNKDINQLLDQQTVLNGQLVAMNEKLDTINNTLDSSLQRNNALLERIAAALEKWSDA